MKTLPKVAIAATAFASVPALSAGAMAASLSSSSAKPAVAQVSTAAARLGRGSRIRLTRPAACIASGQPIPARVVLEQPRGRTRTKILKVTFSVKGADGKRVRATDRRKPFIRHLMADHAPGTQARVHARVRYRFAGQRRHHTRTLSHVITRCGPSSAPAPAPPAPAVPTAVGANAAAFGWGQPAHADDFTGPLGPDWGVYDGAGHGGNGRRSPAAISTGGGVLTITGDEQGTTGGMAWMTGQRYGRWEARMRVPAGDPRYHAVLLLWPDAEDWPVGGEVDFVEIIDPTRQKPEFFLHYGQDNRTTHGEINIDATQWHDWAVEWTPDRMVAYVDGREWFRTVDKSTLPPRSMHPTIQLDWFPGDGSGPVHRSSMEVDWIRQYRLG